MSRGAAIAAAVILSGAPAHATDAPSEHWVGTWAASPQPFMPEHLETFRNQSVRLIVHTSIGGPGVRVRISNAYGTQPLAIGAAHVAQSRKGADIDPATDRALKFEGKTAVMIAPGKSVVSDPVQLEARALSDLAVTFFFPQETQATTNHFLAQQTGYVSPPTGDVTATERFPVAKTIDSWPFLTGIDVLAPARAASVVLFGDSTVDGDGSTENTNQRWSDAVAKRLQQSDRGPQIGVLNQGIIGNRMLADSPPGKFGAALGEAGIRRFARDALDQPGVKCIVVRLGVNDLGFPGSFDSKAGPMTAEALIGGYRQLIERAHRAGVRIVGTTIVPFEGTTLNDSYYSAAKEQTRQQVNAWLRKEQAFDGLIDLDKVLRDPDHPTRMLPAYDSGDHLHPGDAGYAASADAVTLSVLGLE